MAFKVPERYRITSGRFKTSKVDGLHGAFSIPVGKRRLVAIASCDFGWEHVSVSLPDRTPTWEEMCAVKALFWGVGDWVMQYHPDETEYVNIHPFCLHLWRPTAETIPTPPIWMV